MTRTVPSPPAVGPAPAALPHPAPDTVARRARLRSDVRQAARVLATTWPISTFIAVNPLAGLEGVPFPDALRTGEDALGARGTLGETAFRQAYRSGRITRADLVSALRRRVPGHRAAATDLLVADLLEGDPAPPPERRDRTPGEALAPAVADQVDALTTRWVTAYLDQGHSGWPMPERERGLYPAWRALAALDPSVPAAARRRLAALPAEADDAVLAALDDLGIPPGEHVPCLRAHLTRLPGWSSHVRWRADRGGGGGGAGIDLVGYLALRLSYEAALLAATARRHRSPDRREHRDADARARAVRALAALGDPDPTASDVDRAAQQLAALAVRDRALVWLDAYEGRYRDRLLGALHAHRPAVPTGRPAAQVVCCIDVRSEGLRRHLEATGPYETFGFAGFFAVAIRYRGLGDGDTSDQCPALLRPRNDVEERPAPGARALAGRSRAARLALAAAERGAGTAKREPMAPFALAEAVGLLTGPLAAARTLAAGTVAAARERGRALLAPPVPTVVDVDAGFAADEQVLAADVALRTMGLTTGFARLVVLCAHGSTTENNPYAAALDCGACGGSPGGANARTAAALLNRPDVRAALSPRGIDVPPDTCFVAAEHDTVTDRVQLLDRHLVPATHAADLDLLAADLGAAGQALAAERCATLPGAPQRPGRRRAARHVRRRAADWAQVYPEWGLAGNAAFVVGPRAVTAGLDLGRRVFLHSYDPAVDPDGTALETILTAPLVVAQWINCQYYFSTVAPDVFGAGTKTVHNVVGEAGVLAGPGGDLRQGLPWQSVAVGDRLVHEPVRLLAVVQAPQERIDGIVARNRVLQDLLGNEWLAMASRTRPGQEWQRWTPHGWTPWVDQEEERR